MNDEVVGSAHVEHKTDRGAGTGARDAAIVEALPVAVVCVDGAGVVVTANPAMARLFGFAPDELCGVPLDIAEEPAATDQARDHTPGLLVGTGAGSSPGRRIGRRRDGSRFPVDVDVARLRTSAADLEVVVMRAAPTPPRRSDSIEDASLRLLMETVDTLFLLRQDDPPRYLSIGPNCLAVLGVTADELREAGSQLIHADDRERVLADYVTRTQAGEAADSEHRIVTRSGQVRWIHSRSRPVPTSPGTPSRSVVAVNDVTARIDAEEALRRTELAAREANAAKSLFLSRMSHELRTPLNAVLGFGQLLEVSLTGSEHAESVQQILTGGRHLLDLINDVVDISRIEAGQTSISREPVLVRAVVDETIQLMSAIAEGAGVALHSPAGDVAGTVLADRQRLRQILFNLIANAVKYNRRGGRVWVESDQDADDITITVHDDGPGIPTHLQDRLFVPFDRLGAEAGPVDGSGIGLALALSLTELMDGSISVDSELGRGSAFSVRLPRAPDDGPPTLTPTMPTGTGSGRGAGSCTLLYIEDNEPNVRLVERLLALRPEWQLVSVAYGRAGVELAHSAHPTLVLLDLHLPDCSGEDVLAELRRDPATVDLPVVVLTADATVGRSRRLLDAGADRFLTKPFDLAAMLEILDEVAERRSR